MDSAGGGGGGTQAYPGGKALGSKVDPLIRKDSPSTFNSRAIIDATRPYDWKDDFPPVAEASPQLRGRLLRKFPHLLD